MSKSNNLRLTYLQQFKHYPLPLIPLPLKTRPQTMLITMAITTQVQSSTAPGGAGLSGGGPLGGGGGAPSGGGGMPGRGGGGNPVQATVGNGKPMGVLPTIFEGDHSKAESFLWEFSTYLLVNYDVPALASFIKRIAIALTCIKGPEVNRWTQQQLEWLMTLQPMDDNNTTYQQFITNFRNHLMDSQKAQRARIELQTLKMTWPEIDEYISKFESIAHKAGYNPVDHNTMQQFLQGLPQSIGQKVLEDMTVEMYEQMKKKAISVTASQCIINALYRQPAQNAPPWSNFQMNWQTWGQCFQGSQSQQPQQQGFGQAPFNSTTAPRSWNNQPVPMDLDQTRALRKLERMRKRLLERECSQSRWCSNPKGNTGCVLQLWRTRALPSQLPH